MKTTTISNKARAATAVVAMIVAGSASAPAQTTTTPIKHLVVIFQENVSFDHYFATYPNAANPAGSPAFYPRQGPLFQTPTVNGLNDGLMTTNPNSSGPFRLDRSQAVTCDQDHGYTDEQKSFNLGLMDKFPETVGVGGATCDLGFGKNLVMGYYDGNTVTALWNYAQNFAMSDNFFNTTFGPSTPGVLNLVAGQTHGATIVRDTGTANTQVVSGTIIDDIRPAYDDCVPAANSTASVAGQNVGDLLNAKGITWGWFQGGFKPDSRLADGTAVCTAQHADIAGDLKLDYIPHHQPFEYYKSTSNPHHLAPTSVAMIGKTDQANHQYDLVDFYNALNAGNLPAVTYLKAAGYQDGHAGYSSPLDEQTFLVNTINALQDSPLWQDMAVMITYDDSDGWYDHVMPPIVSKSATAFDALTGPGACGTPAPGVYQGRCGYGPRMPFLLVSHYAKVNFVDHTTTDQSSILRFIEDNWGLGRIGDQSFDALAGSLMNMFDFTNDYVHAEKLTLDPSSGQPQ